MMKGVPVDASIQLEVIDSLDSVLSYVDDKQEQAIVVMSLNEISKVKKYGAAKNDLIKIVAICDEGETEKLAEHQKNRGADMYLPGPLTGSTCHWLRKYSQSKKKP